MDYVNHKRYRLQDADVLLQTDWSEASNSSVEIEWDEGMVTVWPVPYVDVDGNPSDHGTPPTFEQLEELVALHALYAKEYAELGDHDRRQIVEAADNGVTGYFACLRRLRAKDAHEAGAAFSV